MLSEQEYRQMQRWVPRLSDEQWNGLVVRRKAIQPFMQQEELNEHDWLLAGLSHVMYRKGLPKPTLFLARHVNKNFARDSKGVREVLLSGVRGKRLSSQECTKLGRLVAEAVLARTNKHSPRILLRLLPHYPEYFNAAYPGYIENGHIRILVSSSTKSGVTDG